MDEAETQSSGWRVGKSRTMQSSYTSQHHQRFWVHLMAGRWIESEGLQLHLQILSSTLHTRLFPFLPSGVWEVYSLEKVHAGFQFMRCSLGQKIRLHTK